MRLEANMKLAELLPMKVYPCSHISEFFVCTNNVNILTQDHNVSFPVACNIYV